MNRPMKKITILTVIIISISSLFAQEIKINEPEFTGTIIYVNDTVGDGMKLEKQTTSTSTKANAAAYVPLVGLAAGKAKSKNVVNGSTSPVKINKKENVKFIIKVASNSADPSTILNVFRLTPEKDKRTLEVASARTIGGSKSGNIEFLPFNGKKYGVSSYLIEFDKMEPGEYAMTLAENRMLFHMFCIPE